jgi:hypothetical protein
MKLLLSLFIAAAIALTLNAQQKEKQHYANPVIPWGNIVPLDTPKVKYWIHFSMRIDTLLYMKSMDTNLIVNDLIGKTLTYEQAIFWKEAQYRSLSRIDQRVRKDTAKIQGGKP